MKKKKKQRSSTNASSAAATTTTDLKSLIREHSLFFDKLIEVIPAKFYLSTFDDNKPWFQGLSKAARASAKQQTRENIKKARRDRHDPEKAQTSTLDLLKQKLDNEKAKKSDSNSDNDNEKEEQGDMEPIAIFGGDNRAPTYEELRQKLHRKLELLRGNRGSGGKSKNERKENQTQKRKRSDEFDKKSDGGDGKDGKLGKSDGEIEKDVNEATKGIEFGKVRIGSEEAGGKRKKKKRKMSKMMELERAKQLEEVRKEDPKVAEKHSWKAATSRAMGEKVHDDPRLLKESIKKEKKRHQKNVEKWKDRLESTKKMKDERQQKRAENIADKIHQKKMRKIAKREKKLMRPGFEGRKEGYITQD